MRESLNESVSVICSYNGSTKQFTLHQLGWASDTFKLGKVDFYHKTKNGLVTIHHYSVADVDGRAYFKLAFDSLNLQWVLEEYMTAGEAVAYAHGTAIG
jgi:hypothetical protein